MRISFSVVNLHTYSVPYPMRHTILLLFILLIATTSYGQKYSLKYIDTKTDASFRGMSVGRDDAVWISGSKGWVGRSTNKGNDWTFRQVAGYEACDFRTVYAFDAYHAIIANAGSPAYVLYTTDGGYTWKEVYKNTDSAAFIDGIDFWNKRKGLIHGDHINGRMLLLYTKDGGQTWKERKQKHRPAMGEGEASFAASGTAISCFLNSAVVVAVGGEKSKLYFSRNRGRRWRSIPTPMLATSASTGIFSIIVGGNVWNWLIAGGDYRNDMVSTANFFYTNNKGKDWHAPQTTTRGYRECLVQIIDEPYAKRSMTSTTLAIGPSGIDISADNGLNWKPLSDEKGFHVMKPSFDKKRMYLAGANGKVAIMRMTE